MPPPMFFANRAAATFHPSSIEPVILEAKPPTPPMVSDKIPNATIDPTTLATVPQAKLCRSCPVCRKIRRRSELYKRSGVASFTTVPWISARFGPGGGSTPTLDSTAVMSIVHTGPDNAVPNFVRSAQSPIDALPRSISQRFQEEAKSIGANPEPKPMASIRISRPLRIQPFLKLVPNIYACGGSDRPLRTLKPLVCASDNNNAGDILLTLHTVRTYALQQ
mmetsp:Transcript_26001/g.49393  ORF Transcript_26001/g.49393 Transcript_26001/m.49393 type:complete len:221 (-) Transcript_26001:501-1163(-)